MLIDAPTPWLVALKGYPGCGKSTVGAALSRQLGWPLIDKDNVQDVLDRHGVAGEGAAYDVVFQVARGQLARGLSVIVDSPLWQRTYDNARALADEVGARLIVVECRCTDETVWRRRIEARQGNGLPPRRTTSWESLQAFRARYDRDRNQDAYPIEVPHLIVDTSTEQPDRVVTRIQDWLRHRATTHHGEIAGADIH